MNNVMNRQQLHPGREDGIRFEEVLELVEDRSRQARPEDRYARLNSFAFVATPEHDALVELRQAGQGTRGLQAHLTPHAFSQLSSRVGPTAGTPAYLRHCPPRLRTLNMSWWLQHNAPKEDALLRLVHGGYEPGAGFVEDAPTVRAVLSGRYEPFDDLDLVRALESLPRIDEAVVRWIDVNDMTSHVRLSWPEERVALRVGDEVERGVHISNSEVGARSVRIEPLVYRLVCTNGLIAPRRLGAHAIRHVGRGDRVRQLVAQAVDDVFGATEQLVDRFKDALDVAISSPVDEITAVAKAGQLTEAQFKNLLDSYLLEPEPTRYGITNAVTLAAQGQDDPVARTDMETLAGRYVTGMRLPVLTDEDRGRAARLAA